jgi:small subunit ribosomal protein S6
LKLPSEAPVKISNILNITDEALRYLLVKADERGRKALEEAKNNDETERLKGE